MVTAQRFPHFIRMMFTVMLCISLAACGMNAIPTLEEEVNAKWADVQNQYKRRADLVPNLVETVKAYATHERETLTAVIEARAKATSVTITPDKLSDAAAMQQFEQNQSALTSALSKLMVVSERYPELKANENFLALQSQLEGTENRITVARHDYILAVQAYNTQVRTFPGIIWAWIYGAKPKASFTAPEAAADAPVVKF